MFEATRRDLSVFMEESGKSQRQISRETGLSTSVISQFLGDTYAGDNQEVAKIISQYLTVGKARLNSVSTVCFYEELYNTKEVLFACSYAHRHNDMALVSGDAGAGKTTALQYYAELNAGVLMVTANACTTTPTAILTLICQKIGKQPPGRRAMLMNLLVEHLKDTNWLIVIDEADHLSLDALQAVRNLNDLAGVGVVLAGNDKIYRQMVAGRKSSEYAQLYSRILIRKKVFNEYTPEEVEAMFPGLSPECIGYLLKLASSESLRIAKKLYDLAQEFASAQGKKLAVKHLRDSHRQLLGEAFS